MSAWDYVFNTIFPRNRTWSVAGLCQTLCRSLSRQHDMKTVLPTRAYVLDISKIEGVGGLPSPNQKKSRVGARNGFCTTYEEKLLATPPQHMTLRVQVPNNHILAQNMHYKYYCPNPKYLIIGSMDPKPYISLYIPIGTYLLGPWTLRARP